MKFIYPSIIALFIIYYFYREISLTKFRENLTIGTKVTYYEKYKTIKGKIESVKKNKLGQVTFVYVNGILIHKENIYKWLKNLKRSEPQF